MTRITFGLTAFAFAAIMTVSAAIAQSAPPAAKTTAAASPPASSKPSTMTQVETWTKKQWDAAKKEWAKDTKKWTGCEQQSSKQKLEGRKSWSFLYTCMTT